MIDNFLGYFEKRLIYVKKLMWLLFKQLKKHLGFFCALTSGHPVGRSLYLKWGQNDPGDVNLRDQNVASDLTDVLKEAQVEIFILEPGQLEVAVDVGAVGVSVSQVAVVVLAVVRNGHPAVGSDANWNFKTKRLK